MVVQERQGQTKRSQLLAEYKIYSMLRGFLGVANVYSYGTIGKCNYMIMDLLVRCVTSDSFLFFYERSGRVRLCVLFLCDFLCLCYGLSRVTVWKVSLTVVLIGSH